MSQEPYRCNYLGRLPVLTRPRSLKRAARKKRAPRALPSTRDATARAIWQGRRLVASVLPIIGRVQDRFRSRSDEAPLQPVGFTVKLVRDTAQRLSCLLGDAVGSKVAAIRRDLPQFVDSPTHAPATRRGLPRCRNFAAEAVNNDSSGMARWFRGKRLDASGGVGVEPRDTRPRFGQSVPPPQHIAVAVKGKIVRRPSVDAAMPFVVGPMVQDDGSERESALPSGIAAPFIAALCFAIHFRRSSQLLGACLESGYSSIRKPRSRRTGCTSNSGARSCGRPFLPGVAWRGTIGTPN